jgi:hypothetical protein
MAVLEKIAFIIKPNQLWDWQRILPQQFLVAHLNPETITSGYSSIYSTSTTPGSPLPKDFYVSGSHNLISFSLEFDDNFLILDKINRGYGTIYRRLNTQDSINWLQAIQLPDINGFNEVGLEIEPPTIMFVWGDRPIYDWKLVVGDINETKFDKTNKKTIGATIPISLRRHTKSFIRR